MILEEICLSRERNLFIWLIPRFFSPLDWIATETQVCPGVAKHPPLPPSGGGGGGGGGASTLNQRIGQGGYLFLLVLWRKRGKSVIDSPFRRYRPVPISFPASSLEVGFAVAQQLAGHQYFRVLKVEFMKESPVRGMPPLNFSAHINLNSSFFRRTTSVMNHRNATLELNDLNSFSSCAPYELFKVWNRFRTIPFNNNFCTVKITFDKKAHFFNHSSDNRFQLFLIFSLLN